MMNKGMRSHLHNLRNMYEVFSTMWQETRPKRYLSFRTYIMGVQGNDAIFPNGVTYRGVWDEPKYFRGETGAQDSIIPATDSAFDLDYPRNQLTEYLFELREYRPRNFQNHIDWLKQQAVEHGIKKYTLENSESSYLMLANVHASFRFRHQHWGMVKKYIIDNTKYPKATGGTPITTWLPNQMGACLEQCQLLMSHIREEDLNGTD